jgi:hypothetical protein
MEIRAPAGAGPSTRRRAPSHAGSLAPPGPSAPSPQRAALHRRCPHVPLLCCRQHRPVSRSARRATGLAPGSAPAPTTASRHSRAGRALPHSGSAPRPSPLSPAAGLHGYTLIPPPPPARPGPPPWHWQERPLEPPAPPAPRLPSPVCEAATCAGELPGRARPDARLGRGGAPLVDVYPRQTARGSSGAAFSPRGDRCCRIPRAFAVSAFAPTRAPNAAALPLGHPACYCKGMRLLLRARDRPGASHGVAMVTGRGCAAARPLAARSSRSWGAIAPSTPASSTTTSSRRGWPRAGWADMRGGASACRGERRGRPICAS